MHVAILIKDYIFSTERCILCAGLSYSLCLFPLPGSWILKNEKIRAKLNFSRHQRLCPDNADTLSVLNIYRSGVEYDRDLFLSIIQMPCFIVVSAGFIVDRQYFSSYARN